MGEIAHIDPQTGREHPLDEHLKGVGELAAAFGAKFSAQDWARLTGLLHDLGKYRPAFQEKIRAADGENAHLEGAVIAAPAAGPSAAGTTREEHGLRVDHSSVGAAYIQEKMESRGAAAILAIAGHHGGLPNFDDWQESRYPKTRQLLGELQFDKLPKFLREPIPKGLAPFWDSSQSVSRGELLRRAEFKTRMLFSALVDADYLDTESFYSQKETGLQGGFPPLRELSARLERFLNVLSAGAEQKPVNVLRRQVIERCRIAASGPPGVFSLTAPTGGGKTYASLSFALRHALANKLDRIVVVAPFLTIIDQTVNAYRKALSAPGVDPNEVILVEQHGGMEPGRENPRNRLASENWDAPLIVTAAVQFFESLFAARPSECRKLHNLARSVIIVEEAQTLPGDLLVPILEVLQGLADHYGSSIVLSAAAQPELTERTHPDGRRFGGFKKVVELAGLPEQVQDSFRTLERVKVDRLATKGWDEIADAVSSEKRVLAITHARRDARELSVRVKTRCAGEPLFHLSALMCARHRQEIGEEIKKGLSVPGKPLRAVSTQPVEAGVDLDFPVVFRAWAGLDAIIQAAGRCNREGRLMMGRLVLFDAPTEPPLGYLRKAADQTKTICVLDSKIDILGPEAYRRFDRSLDRIQDKRGIQSLREQFKFEDVARTFKLIENDRQATVIIPWGPPGNRGHSVELLKQAEYVKIPSVLRMFARRLQGYSVSIPKRQAEEWLEAGVLYAVQDLFLALAPAYRHLYTEEFGLELPQDLSAADPAALIG